MTKREAQDRQHMFAALQALGFTFDECKRLRRISMTLRRWHELECGTDNGCIERDLDGEGVPYWSNPNTGRRYKVADRENGAKKLLQYIIHSRNCRTTHGSNGEQPNDLSAYIQCDPRGAALYILRPGDVPAGKDADAYYSRGICVY